LSTPSILLSPGRRSPACERGQSLVELALLLPVILFVAMGVLDLGRAMYAYVAVSNAAQAGAEFAARNPTYNASAVTDAALYEGGAFLQSQSGSIVVVANEENGSQVRVVRVTVRYEFTPINPVLFSVTMPIQVTAAAPM
jgi:Flp pilus assembly protein TadG